MPLLPLSNANCPDCGAEVVWGALQNGRRRTFDRQPMKAADVAPGDRYAYSRRLRAVVCLDGEPRLPELVLRAHRCRQYIEARNARREMQGVDSLADLLTPTEQEIEAP